MKPDCRCPPCCANFGLAAELLEDPRAGIFGERTKIGKLTCRAVKLKRNLTGVIFHGVSWRLACVAGVQRGGRGEVECEREARSLDARLDAWFPTSAQRSRFALSSRFALAFNFPLPPLCTPATQATWR